jgi:methylmalonyl-CoA mutase
MFIFPLGNPVLALKAFFEWADSTAAPTELISGGLLWSPSDLVFESAQPFGLGIEILSELLEMTEPYSMFKAFSVNTSRYSESGANPIDALVFGFGELIESLDQLSKDPRAIFSKLCVHVSVGEHHFGEIARIKALRKTVVEFAGLYGLTIKEEEVVVFCQTSHWSKSILDIHTNLIRQTYEAMAAVLGGANFLWVKPLQEENAGELERRMARNVSTILREESYLDKVMDPTAGSFYLETLTSEIQMILKIELQQLEAKGGWEKALQSGQIHASVRKNREKIQNQVLDNQLPRIGASTYPAPIALQKNLEWESFEEKMHELKPSRATYLVELQTLAQP